MSIRKILYPLDFSGDVGSNRIEGELQTIGTDRYRAFTVKFAPFFVSNLTVKERGKPTLLKRGTDYECLYYYPDLSKLAGGKEICGVIVITNSSIGTDLEIGYNTVGGHYAASAALIAAAIADINLDNRNVYWKDIIDKPDLFQPAPHLHDIGDVYGFEFIIDTLVNIRETLLIGDNTVHQQILDRIDNIVLVLTQQLDSHRGNIDNPHNTTAHQTGAYTKEEVDTLVLGIMNDLAELEPRFQNIATQFMGVTQQFQALDGTIVGLSNRIGLVELEQSKFDELLAVINETLANLQGQIDNVIFTISTLQTKDAALQKSIDGLASDISGIKNKNTAQDNRLSALEDHDQLQDSNITNNTNDITNLKKLATDANKAVSDINNSLSNYVPWTSTTLNINRVYADLIDKVAFIPHNGDMQIGSSISMHHPSVSTTAVSLYVSPSTTPMLSTVVNTGYFNCQDIYIRSDIRDKHDITRIDPIVADTILRKLGSGIRYKLQSETVHTAGLSAQEVLEVFPEAIGTIKIDDDVERLTMRHNAIVGLLVSGYNRQAAQLDELLAKLAYLSKTCK